VIVAPNGRLTRALLFTIEDDRIVAMEVLADADRLATLEVAVLDA